MSVRGPVLAPVAAVSGIAPGHEHHVDVRILAMILVVARADRQDLRVTGRAVLQAMPVAHSGTESGAVAGTQDLLAALGHEHDLAGQDIDELVLALMPVALARPAARRKPEQAHAELREPGR